MKYKSIKSNLKYFILLLALYSFFLIPNTSVRATSPTRYYAGYFGNNNPDGIRGKILTIDSSVPLGEFFSEWISIGISYSPLYWIQLGYTQRWTWWIFPPFPYITLDFYLERQDAYFYWITYCILKPIVGITYTYELYYKEPGPYAWHFKVCEGQTTIWFGDTFTNPSSRIDLSAFVETTVTSIDIDGSHFTNLKYYNDPNWYLWSYHTTYNDDDPPYWTESISHHEFYA